VAKYFDVIVKESLPNQLPRSLHETLIDLPLSKAQTGIASASNRVPDDHGHGKAIENAIAEGTAFPFVSPLDVGDPSAILIP